jgi:hydroxymethylglutaryl-CoA synthase
LGLLSTLTFYDTKKKLQELHLVLAYGSGSKSKGFEGTIQQDWQLALVNTNLFQTLENNQ